MKKSISRDEKISRVKVFIFERNKIFTNKVSFFRFFFAIRRIKFFIDNNLVFRKHSRSNEDRILLFRNITLIYGQFKEESNEA